MSKEMKDIAKSVLDYYVSPEDLKEFHQESIDADGGSDASFYPKVFYVPKENRSLGINVAFFKSELSKGDIYLEQCNFELQPLDENRKLYKWTFDSKWEEYIKTPVNSNGSHRYYVPADKLVLVKDYSQSKTVTKAPQESKQIKMDLDSVGQCLVNTLTGDQLTDLFIDKLIDRLTKK